MKTRLELGTIWIIEGNDKRVLECYVDERLFTQRKTFDEYYIDVTNHAVNIEIGDLMVLAENFKVLVTDDAVIISDK